MPDFVVLLCLFFLPSVLRDSVVSADSSTTTGRRQDSACFDEVLTGEAETVEAADLRGLDDIVVVHIG